LFFVKGEDKLDKLPPVPPSVWSANSSMRRRNGQNQSSFITNNNNSSNNNSNHRYAPKSKFANRSQGNLVENNEKINEMDEYDNNEHNMHKQPSSFNYELSIHEPGDQDQASSSPKNYDNIKSKENDEQNDEKIDVVINKDFRFKDFGFTIAEGLYGNGIYVHKIREGSPADSNYFLKPLSKIYKINNFDCTKIESTTPALKIMNNETSNFIRLTISKRPKMNVLLNEDKSTSSASSTNSSRATAL